MLELMNLVVKGKKKEFTGDELQKLLASDGATNDFFGRTVTVSGNGSIVVVGAYGDSDRGSGSGSAYVFTKQTNGSYVQSQKLTASDGARDDYFGYSVSISDDGSVIIVGAYYDDDKGTDSGSVYVFTKQASGIYTQSQKLVASDGARDDYFGYSVSLSSDSSVIVASAYGDDDKGNNSGSIYVFTKQASGLYVQSQKLTASDGVAIDRFGFSISVNGNGSIIIASSYCDDDRGTDSGSVYVFTKQSNGSYIQSQKLLASDGATADLFGYSVSISSDGFVIVAGAYADDDKGTESGSAYVFTRQVNGNYIQSQKLIASDGAAIDNFGFSVTVSGDGSAIAVGSYCNGEKGTYSGAAYVFTKQATEQYIQSKKLVASDGAAYDNFGVSVAIANDSSTVVAGAYCDDDKGDNSGAAYVFN